MLRPVGGGALRQPVAENVEYVDDPKNAIFLRGAGGIAQPQARDVQRVLRELGILTDPDIQTALLKDDAEAAARALAANPQVVEWLAREAAQRADIRDRIEVDNRRGAKPAGHIPVSEVEYIRAQRMKAQAVILQAAKRGFFADKDGNPRRLDREIQKDLFGDYVGDEKDVAMRDAYVQVKDKIEELQRAGGNTVVLGDVRATLADVGQRRLNDRADRVRARERVTNVENMFAAIGEKDAADLAAELGRALDTWGEEWDRKQAAPGAGAVPPPAGPPFTPPRAPEPPAAPAPPVSIVRPGAPAPEPPAAPTPVEDAQGLVGRLFPDVGEVDRALAEELAQRLGQVFVNDFDDLNDRQKKAAIFDVVEGFERYGLGGDVAERDGRARDDREPMDAIVEYAENLGGVGDGALGRYLGPNADAFFDRDVDQVRDNIVSRDRAERGDVAPKVVADVDLVNRALDGAGLRAIGLRGVLDRYNANPDDVTDDERNNLAQYIDDVARDNVFDPGVQRQLRDVADRIGRKERLNGAPEPVAAPEPAPSPEPETGKLDLPDIDDADIEFVRVRGRIKDDNMDAVWSIKRGDDPDRQKLDGAIDDLDKMIERYNRNGRNDKREQAQRVKDALTGVRDQMDAREQAEREAVTPEGRTQAVENIADAIADRAAELRKNRQRAKAGKIEDAADDLADALDRAEEAHNADNKEDRDAALADADDAAEVFFSEGEDGIGERVKRDIQGNRNRFQADDNRVPPMERQEGVDRVADKWEQVGRDLRAQGAEGRKKRRDFQRYLDEFDEAIDEAEAEHGKNRNKERDQNLNQAERMVEEARQLDPELADVMEEVLAGQRQRILDTPQADELFPDPYLPNRSGDPTFRDRVDGNSPEAVRLREVAAELRGQSLDSISRKVKAGEIPRIKSVKRLNAKGINGVQKLVLDDGSILILKYDKYAGSRGARAEDAGFRLAQGLGLRAPNAVALNPDDPSQERGGMVLMQYTKDLLDPDEIGIEDAQDVQGINGAVYSDLSSYTEQGLREMLGLVLLDTLMMNTDRHSGNWQFAYTADGKLRPVVIDNGFGFSNRLSSARPSGMARPEGRGADSVAKKWLRSIGEDAARAEMEQFLTRIRAHAEKMRVFDDQNDAIVRRAQWALDNLDSMVKGWR